ncbi:hypothetical protein Desku_1399 [Desulfofundulus kuznetsovii DSM 6115]|uniref:Uncharacterized protein n=1 Tax=Desulfofundulus kuznetsovii (strain DSM 6115 / VKM B-1805 / 17) TaxID=760568 RepID=A0AAU8PMM8_DESK7|nr:hypothetical protein Desku_1399 [Desulfofundulus kuznetsovii DSM 6115]
MDFPKDGMPEFLRFPECQRWTVYNQYKIYTPTEAECITMSRDSGLTALTHFLQDEHVWVDPNSGISRIYNPFTEAPELFLEFAALGRTEQPRKDKILDFLYRYGDIFNEHGHQSLKIGQWNKGSNVTELHREARLCYYALRLYEGLFNNSTEALKTRVCDLLSHLIECSHIPIVVDNDENNGVKNGSYTDYLPLEVYIQRKLLSGQIIDTASFLLVNVINQKVHNMDMKSPILPICFYRFDYKNKKSLPAFYMTWVVPSLLQAIWLLFFLKITGQIEQEYRICPVCEEPIIKPRKNQLYHEGCRQVYHNRIKREVLRLWKEGKSIDEIAAETAIDTEKIKKWVKKGRV